MTFSSCLSALVAATGRSRSLRPAKRDAAWPWSSATQIILMAKAPLKEIAGQHARPCGRAQATGIRSRRRREPHQGGDASSDRTILRQDQVRTSTALIFFSGHGIQSNRQTYIVPVNAQIWTEADVRRDGFNLDSILAEMNSKGARVKIAILDASRRNPFERRFRSVPAGTRSGRYPKNTAVMYAAAPSMVVRDGDRSAVRGRSCSRRFDRRARSKRCSTAPSPACRRHPGASRRHGFPRRWSMNFHFAAERAHNEPVVDRSRTGCAERVPVRRAHRHDEGPGRISSPSIPRDVIPTLHVTGSRSWIHPGKGPVTTPTRAASTSPPNAPAPEGPGRTSSPSIPRDVIPILHATGSRSWILPGKEPITMPTRGASTSPPSAPAPEGPGRTSSPSIPPDVMPILRVTGSRSWIHPGKERDNDADARSEYQSAERTGTRRAWEDFLAKYPSGRYSDLARDRLAKLDPPRQRTDSDADARSEYQSAERTGTRRAWENFLARYPSGRYSDLARDQLAESR